MESHRTSNAGGECERQADETNRTVDMAPGGYQQPMIQHQPQIQQHVRTQSNAVESTGVVDETESMLTGNGNGRNSGTEDGGGDKGSDATQVEVELDLHMEDVGVYETDLVDVEQPTDTHLHQQQRYGQQPLQYHMQPMVTRFVANDHFSPMKPNRIDLEKRTDGQSQSYSEKRTDRTEQESASASASPSPSPPYNDEGASSSYEELEHRGGGPLLQTNLLMAAGPTATTYAQQGERIASNTLAPSPDAYLQGEVPMSDNALNTMQLAGDQRALSERTEGAQTNGAHSNGTGYISVHTAGAYTNMTGTDMGTRFLGTDGINSDCGRSGVSGVGVGTSVAGGVGRPSSTVTDLDRD